MLEASQCLPSSLLKRQQHLPPHPNRSQFCALWSCCWECRTYLLASPFLRDHLQDLVGTLGHPTQYACGLSGNVPTAGAGFKRPVNPVTEQVLLGLLGVPSPPCLAGPRGVGSGFWGSQVLPLSLSYLPLITLPESLGPGWVRLVTGPTNSY